MVVFPNAKINLGLHIISKRDDGFHNIETCFYPVNWTDALEIMPSSKLQLSITGLNIADSKSKKGTDVNLCTKAWQLLKKKYNISPVHIHLHKEIPVGAGLGGGSADAAFTIKTLNDVFNLGLSLKKMEAHASVLGSDCAFFIKNTPMFAREKGDVFEPINIDLKGYYCVLIYPGISISTSKAYSSIIPTCLPSNKPTSGRQEIPENRIKKIITSDIYQWKDVLKNDFERPVFAKYPQLAKIKGKLYDYGAIYASMSGSGSCVYGIFDGEPDTTNYEFTNYELRITNL
ncbi:MAG: 4-(cytidine 5'-diphospho)-2-C-methyl-D-erythritol kinase [Cytophagales bacterium]|nr:4-(cytidine 5'-diphospho)-2-C-methyl-D-erythritol kinase [Cytophagales bacterium]